MVHAQVHMHRPFTHERAYAGTHTHIMVRIHLGVQKHRRLIRIWRQKLDTEES